MGEVHDYEYLFKFVLVGDPAVGKSSIMTRYVDNTYDDAYL
jgi:GTPase SAR1 family protein